VACRDGPSLFRLYRKRRRLFESAAFSGKTQVYNASQRVPTIVEQRGHGITVAAAALVAGLAGAAIGAGAVTAKNLGKREDDREKPETWEK